MKNKLIAFLLIAFLLLLIGAGLLAGFWFFRAAEQGEAKLAITADQLSDGYSLGSTINLKAQCLLPWGQSLSDIACQPGEGIFQAGDIKTATQSISRFGRSLSINVPLKSSRTGQLDLGKLQLTVERPLFKNALRKTNLSADAGRVMIKPFKITDPDQLPLVNELFMKQQPVKYHYFLAGAILLLLLLVYIIFKFRSKKAQSVLLPWEIAQQELAKLRTAPDKYPLSWCVAKLTDVVRNYLTDRFQWPVSSRTTGEFFAELRRENHQLTPEQIRYLEDFLSAADLVKFANLRPEMDSYQQAVERAGKLIEETRSDQNSAETAQKTSV